MKKAITKENNIPVELVNSAEQIQKFIKKTSVLANRDQQLFGLGSALNRYDASLVFSYRHALEIALDVFQELNETEKNQVRIEIYNIFEIWKNEHGIYPAHLDGLLFLLSAQPEPAREYIKRQYLAAALSGEEPKYIAPWECDRFARTPVRLFFKLFSEDYPPLKEYMEKERLARYDYILATVIIMSQNSDSEYQFSDCIEGAFKLAQMRMRNQNSLIKFIEPLARETFVRNYNAKIKREATKEETERKVIELHQKFLNDGNIPPYKEYAAILGYSVSTISRILKKNYFAKYKS